MLLINNIRHEDKDELLKNKINKGEEILETFTKPIEHFFKWDCSDPGFRGKEAIARTEKFINGIIPLKGRPYVLSKAGVTLNYIHGNPQTIEDNWENDIHSLVRSANIEVIIIIQHEECLAYELRYGKLSPKKESRCQKEDMQKAKKILTEEHPDVIVITAYGNIVPNKNRSFVLSEIN